MSQKIVFRKGTGEFNQSYYDPGNARSSRLQASQFPESMQNLDLVDMQFDGFLG